MEPRNDEPRFGVRMVVAYDGSRFHGFQKQPDTRTVQGVLTDAVRRLDPSASETRGASRTDAGVHARGQVVAFDTSRALPPKGWRMQLNTSLPEDVSVREVVACEPGFEPRFDSVRKLYRYRVHVGESRDPLRDGQSMHLGPARARKDVMVRGERVEDYLDLDAMREAARRLEGRHDFRAYRSADDARENSVRTLHAVRIPPPSTDEPDALALDFEGDAFMKNMVRILVGTLLEVGRGAMRPEAIDGTLGALATRALTGPTAPAHGLCLMRVELGRAAWVGATTEAATKPAPDACSDE